ncbi:MAG: VOC family protein [Acidobacteriota bacterium]|jgi:predicted enzyme related to lactoylglutathione lyase
MGNPVVHFEVGCRDKDRTTAFYSELFGWTPSPHGPSSAKLDTGSQRGIGGHVTSLGHEPHTYVMFYVEVDDIPEAIAAAEALGGSVLIGELPTPDGGSFAWLQDPEGNSFGLLRPPGDA